MVVVELLMVVELVGKFCRDEVVGSDDASGSWNG